MSEKTEPPTPKRLKQAKEHGDSGASPFFTQSVAFLAAAAIVPATVRSLASSAAADTRSAILEAGSRDPLQRAIDASSLATEVLALALPVLLASAAVTAVVVASQTGGVFAMKRLSPEFGRLNPTVGVVKLFSSQRLFVMVRALAYGIAVTWFAARVAREHLVDLARTAGHASFVATVTADLAQTTLLFAGSVGLILGVVDLLVTRRSWMHRLRMSKEEIRREQRDNEGDPALKRERARAREEFLAEADIANAGASSVEREQG